MPDLETLPRLLLRNAREFPRRAAMREKDRGIWQAWTWHDYAEHVRDLALGLAALGFKRGDRLIIMIYAFLDEKETAAHRMRVAVLDEKNNVVQIKE